MSYFVYYSTLTGQISNCVLATYNPWPNPPVGMAVLTLPQTNQGAAQAVQLPTWYLVQSGKLVLQPAWTLAASTPVGGDATTPATVTLTATLNNAPATPPTEATFGILGASFQAPVEADEATLTVQIHPAVASYLFGATVTASGTVQGATTFGGSVPNQIGLQCVVPTGGTLPMIAPVGPESLDFLKGYWASLVPEANLPGDLAVQIGLLAQAVTVLWQACTQGTAPIFQPNSNQQNLMNDWDKNIIPTMMTTLDNAAPSSTPGVFEPQYAQVREDWITAGQAMEAFANDRMTLPGLE